METPVSIQVVPQQVLQDQQVIRFSKAIENVSGVIDQSRTGANVFMIRGFRTTEYYRDGGVRIQSGSSIVGDREVANLERIEVLKGPGSILYGRTEPGGIINLVTKQPLPSPYYALQQQFGSFDLYRTTIDATGPITRDHTLLYRLNLAYENAGSFREFVDNERVFVAPVLRWNISDKTEANVYLEYQHNRFPLDTGGVAIGDRPAPLPRERNLGEPFSTGTSDDVMAGFDWSHAFNDRWNLRHRFNAHHNAFDLITVFGAGFDETDPTRLLRLAIPQMGQTQTYYTSLDLTGKLDTWGLEHTLLLGGDYFRFHNDFLARFTSTFPSIDIFNPVHTVAAPVVDPALDFPLDTTDEWYGLYLQDQIRLPYHLHLLGGLRYDNATQHDELTDTDVSDKDAVSPRVGLLWQPLPQLSLYGNYVENFGAVNTGTLSGGSLLPPQTAQQWEVGLKTELLDDLLTGTLAYYDLTKQDIPAPDPLNPVFFVATGEARNRGVELDVAGEILPGWKVIGTYSYIDSEITKDTEDRFGNPIGNQGHRLFNVPRHSGSLWTTFEPQARLWRGLKLGAGLVARGQREGDNANSFQLPGYATVNLMGGLWLEGRALQDQPPAQRR